MNPANREAHMTKGSKVSAATRAKMSAAQKARYKGAKKKPKAKKAKRRNWLAEVASLRSENANLKTALEEVQGRVSLVDGFARAVFETMRDEISDMVHEEIDSLEINVGF